jgi:hypothetical protein
MPMFRVDYFQFVWFLSKKSNQIDIKKTKTGSNRPVSVWFFRTKTCSNRFDSVFSVLTLFFLGLAQVFSWFGFGLIFSVPGL